MTGELFRAARCGNRGAVGRLLNRHRRALLLLATEQLANRSAVGLDEGQLVERTLLVAQADFEQFAGAGDDEWLRWLETIMRRVVAQCTAELDNTELDNTELDNRELDNRELDNTELDNRELAERLQVALATLPCVQGQVLRLRAFNRWSLTRMAAHLGLDKVVVAGLLRVALRRLHESLEPEDVSGE